MNQTRRRAWSGLAIWGVAGLVFAATFFAAGGPTEFAAERGRVLAGAVALGVAYLAYFVMIWRTRSRGKVAADERDERVLGRAGRGALVVVLLWVYVVGIGLWVGYDAQGVVPVGWMWFLAYGTVIVGSLAHATGTLVEDGRLGGNE